MVRRVRQVVLAAGLVGTTLAGGCTTIKDHRGYLVDRTLMNAVEPGIDNRLSVERTLGRPTFASQFGQQDWYYVSINTRQAPFQRAKTQDQQVMRVRFDPTGNVAAVDRFGMEHVARIGPDGHATPTLGRDRSFLEDLFGNIGQVGAPGAGTGPTGSTGPGPNGS